MASLLINDITGIVRSLLFKHRTMKCCTKYKETYRENEGIVMLRGIHSYNYRDLNIRVRYPIFKKINNSMKITNVCIPKNY